MTFELDQTAQADQLRRAQSNPLDPSELSPGFFTGSLSAPFTGVGRALAKSQLFLGDVAAAGLKPIAKSADDYFGTDVAGFIEHLRGESVNVVKSFTPDPHTTGMAGHVLSGVFDVLPTALAGGPLTAGVLEGYAQKRVLESQGVDPKTAAKVGLVQGASTALGVGLPLSIGLRAAPDLLYAAASSAVPGAEARALTRKFLSEGGYHDMAAQYDPLDAHAIAADAVLGAFFAGAGRLASRVLPSHVDAALTAKDAHHLELDSAPGVPRDAVTRDAHVASVLKATEDLLAGRPVEVAEGLGHPDFQPNPRRGELAHQVDQAVREHLGDAYDRVLADPAGPSNDPLVRITSQEIGDVLVERGQAVFDKSGEVDIKKSRFGLVKIIWKHGERSKTAPELQVTREDVQRIPEVIRDFVPIEDRKLPDGQHILEWHVARADGKSLVYAVRRFHEGDGEHHVVTVMVNEGKSKAMREKPLSERANRPAESPDGAFTARLGDTGPESSSIVPPGGQKGGSEGTVAREGAGAEDPIVEHVRAAVADMPDLQVMDDKGEALPAAEALKLADQGVADAEKSAKAFGAAVSCFLRHGT